MSDHKSQRFCGRCQTWLRDAIEVHVCTRAPRLIGYAWFEPDEPAIEKNGILQEGRPFKRGKLVEKRPAQAAVQDEAVERNE